MYACVYVWCVHVCVRVHVFFALACALVQA
jgi:hypothetical protein